MLLIVVRTIGALIALVVGALVGGYIARFFLGLVKDFGLNGIVDDRVMTIGTAVGATVVVTYMLLNLRRMEWDKWD